MTFPVDRVKEALEKHVPNWERWGVAFVPPGEQARPKHEIVFESWIQDKSMTGARLKDLRDVGELRAVTITIHDSGINYHLHCGYPCDGESCEHRLEAIGAVDGYTPNDPDEAIARLWCKVHNIPWPGEA